MKRSGFILVAAVVLAAGATTQAHEGATGVAKDRMDLMQSMSKDMKEIARRVSANRDLAAIADMASRIEATAPKIPPLFPPGSGTGITDAKPDIWQHWDDFQAKVQVLQKESATLAAMAGSGEPSRIGAQFKTVIRACTDCHSDFRRGRADKY